MKRLLCAIFGCDELGPRALLDIRDFCYGRVIELTERGSRIMTLELVPQAASRKVQVWARLCSRCGR